MESLSYRQLQIVEDLLEQIHHAILDLKEWNKGIDNPDAKNQSRVGMFVQNVRVDENRAADIIAKRLKHQKTIYICNESYTSCHFVMVEETDNNNQKRIYDIKV